MNAVDVSRYNQADETFSLLLSQPLIIITIKHTRLCFNLSFAAKENSKHFMLTKILLVEAMTLFVLQKKT